MMARVKYFFSRHYLAILLAVAVSGLMYLPQYRLQVDLGSQYHDVLFTDADSELYYDARIRDVYDGHWKLANAFAFEYKDLPYIQPPLPEIISAGLGWLSLSAEPEVRTYFAARVAMPFLLFLLIYFASWKMSRSRLTGLVCAAAVVLGLEFLQNWKLILDLFFLRFPGPGTLAFGRPVSPQMGVAFFFLYLMFFWDWLQARRSTSLWISAVVLGMSFYAYAYTWAFILVGNGLLLLYFLGKKDYRAARQMLLLYGIAAVVALPYFYNVYKFYQLPYREVLAFMQGGFPSRRFYMNWTAVLTLLLLLAFDRGRGTRFWLLVALLSGGFIAVNQQLITGQELTPAHFHWYFIAVVSGLAVIFLLFDFLVRALPSRNRIAIGAMVILCLFGYGLYKQTASYEAGRDRFYSEQRFGALYDWLNAHTPKDSVVLVADRNRADAIAYYTHNNLYYASFMFLSNTPDTRLKDMHYLNLRLQGIEPQDAEAYLRAHPNLVAELVGGFSTRRMYGCRTCFDDSQFSKMADEYRSYAARPMADLLNLYKLDYIVVDTLADAWRPDGIPGATLVAVIGDFVIYSHAPVTFAAQ